jgi:DNA invertase Pin-like site-specific DNA recombinase
MKGQVGQIAPDAHLSGILRRVNKGRQQLERKWVADFAVDTTTPPGRVMLQMLGAFAEVERSMVRERTRMGLKAARERGRIGGRKPKLEPNQRAEIIKMVNDGAKSVAEAARLFNVHRSTISRLLGVERSTTN